MSTMRLIEELAELQHALCKAERFGWDNVYRDTSNKKWVEAEMLDVLEQMRHVITDHELTVL